MPHKPRLVHESYQALLAKAAKYDDPNNLDWEWGDHIPKMERHAINAAVDLRDALAREAALLIMLAEGVKCIERWSQLHPQQFSIEDEEFIEKAQEAIGG